MPARHAGLAHLKVSQTLERDNPKWVQGLDRALVFVALLGPIATIPQIVKIFFEKNAQGLSLISWSIFLALSVPWIVYGFVHREKPIFFAYIFYFFTNLLVVIGIMLYS